MKWWKKTIHNISRFDYLGYNQRVTISRAKSMERFQQMPAYNTKSSTNGFIECTQITGKGKSNKGGDNEYRTKKITRESPYVSKVKQSV